MITESQAKRLVTKRGPHGFPSEHFWVCPVCGNVFEKQTDAQNCCSDKRTTPGFPSWYKPRPPVGKINEGIYKEAPRI